MTRFTSSRWITATVIAVSLVATAFAAQPPKPGTAPPDPLDVAKARQKIADQKAESEVLEVIQNADRLAKTNPVKAAQLVKTARGNMALAVGVSEEARGRLSLLLDQKLAILEGRKLPNPPPGL